MQHSAPVSWFSPQSNRPVSAFPEIQRELESCLNFCIFLLLGERRDQVSVPRGTSGTWMAWRWPWLPQLVVGLELTGPAALPFPPPCSKWGLAAEKNLVWGTLWVPFAKDNHVLVSADIQYRREDSRGTQQCMYTAHCFSYSPSLLLNRRKG